MDNYSRDQIIGNGNAAIPFTARLICYYLAQERKQENPLIIDQFADRLVGDLPNQ